MGHMKTRSIENFQRLYQKWKHRLHRYVDALGYYLLVERYNKDVWKNKIAGN